MTYAANTTVSSDKSRSEIERTLVRYGADQFLYGWSGDSAVVGFRMNGRQIKIIVPMPDKKDRIFTHSQRGPRSPEAAQDLWEKACRQRWRAMALVVKAKLEAAECGISTFEDEFLAHMVLPDGRTAGQWLKPQIEEAYRIGTMPEMLPALPPPATQ